MSEKIIATNREARHNYTILEAVEAGIELKGSEVKSLRQGGVSLKESFARVEKDGVYLYNCHITPYGFAAQKEEPLRLKKLLLHKAQINKLAGAVAQKGWTIVPLRMYFKHGIAKVELALAKGKRQYDKRETIKRRESELDIRRAMRRK